MPPKRPGAGGAAPGAGFRLVCWTIAAVFFGVYGADWLSMWAVWLLDVRLLTWAQAGAFDVHSAAWFLTGVCFAGALASVLSLVASATAKPARG